MAPSHRRTTSLFQGFAAKPQIIILVANAAIYNKVFLMLP
jgi:hypothetical protein